MREKNEIGLGREGVEIEMVLLEQIGDWERRMEVASEGVERVSEILCCL